MNALGLGTTSESIKQLFNKAGFKRDFRTYCLSHTDRQIAFFIVNQSDVKINLSDLINGIKIIILEQDKLSRLIFSAAVHRLSHFFNEKSIPLLIYPSHYLPSQNIHEEKQYTLWILDTNYAGEEYLAYMNRIMKFTLEKE